MKKRLETRPGLRQLAIETLLTAEAEHRYVDDALAGRLASPDARAIAPRDRRLLQEIVFGVTRARNTIDHLLGTYLERALDKQDAPLRWALRCGAYQLVHLLRVPAHAAVHQTVEALKQLRVSRKASGFVNAVLHRLSKDIHRKSADAPVDHDDRSAIPIRDGWCHFRHPVLPSARVELEKHLALEYSHPEWLVRRWLPRFGRESLERLLVANNRPPRTHLRVTSLAPSRDAVVESLRAAGIEAEIGEREDSLWASGGDLSQADALAKGWFQAQDPTAAAIGRVLAPPPGARVLDLCAAPGGKAVQLLEAIGPAGFLFATDRSEERLGAVTENLSRIGTNFTTRVVPDEPEAIDLGERFSHVLLDAPCSNTGVLARRAEARWRLTEHDIASLVELQSRLLDAAVRHLAAGGTLVYATCSIEPEENEARVAALRESHALEEVRSETFLPHESEGDGGFVSILRRPS